MVNIENENPRCIKASRKFHKDNTELYNSEILFTIKPL